MTKAKTKHYSGWMVARNRWGMPLGYEAYRRDEHHDVFDVWRYSTWWEALAWAMELAHGWDCEFEGGPSVLTDWLDRRAAQ